MCEELITTAAPCQDFGECGPPGAHVLGPLCSSLPAGRRVTARPGAGRASESEGRRWSGPRASWMASFISNGRQRQGKEESTQVGRRDPCALGPGRASRDPT